MQLLLLNEFIIIFSLSIMVFLIFSYFKIPAVVGFLLTGLLAGPHGLGLIKSVHEVDALAEIGIVLLLFTIGIEFSFKDFLKMKRTILLGGVLQVLLTILGALGISMLIGKTFNESLFIGFLVSLSSTAIVLKILQERAEVDSPHGRATLGILIFQDIAVVPMMLIVPLLGGAAGNLSGTLLYTILKGLGVIVLVIISAKWVIPQILYRVTKTRNRELFLLSVIVICFSVAWLTSSIGLSLALGAFLAGLIISESDYNHEALGHISPFKDIFTSIFFISVGMILDIKVFIAYPGLIIIIVLGVLLLKTIMAGLSVVLLGFPLRTGILVGLKLLQIGEFSFILSKVGVEHGLLNGNTYQIFLAVSVLTMVTTPFAIANAHRIADIILRIPFSHKLKTGYHSEKFTRKKRKSNHVIIIGFGLNGKNLARASAAANIVYTIIEMDTQIVREERKCGQPIFHGDATHEAVLEFADVKEAKIVVIAISDLVTTRKIVSLIRRINPKVHIIVRTRYFQEVGNLYGIGASEVIPEEFETSIEIFTSVLEKYLIPREEIESFIREVRVDGYRMFRTLSNKAESSFDLKHYFPEAQISTFRVRQDATIIGKTLSDIDLRKEYNVTLLSVQRDSKLILIPDGTLQLYSNDVVVIIGEPEKIAKAAELF